METKELKINLGSGRKRLEDYQNLDCTQIVDGRGVSLVDVVIDLEKESLPYEDNSAIEILADNVLEHVDNLIGVLNECWRVLDADGVLVGCVPIAGTEYDFKDPTHKRHFTRDTFSYFTGVALWDESKPSRPKYADYGFKPWILEELKNDRDLLLYFKMRPRK